MSAVFESETLGPTERLIMLALADHADDEGRCYPSIGRLCRRTGLKDRSIQNNLKSLSDQGYIRVVHNGGKSGSNLYFVSAVAGTFVNAPFASPVFNEVGGSKKGKRPEPAVNRFTIFGRDNYTCVYCGFQDTKDGNDAGLALHVDHAVPLSRGGSNSAENLCTACVRCNLMKGDMTAEEFENDPRRKCTPQEMHPAFGDIQPPHMTAKTPAADAPKPSRTITEPSIPEANASGRDASESADPKKEFWEKAKAFLSKNGIPQSQSGSFIGKCIREHGLDRTREAFRAAQAEKPAEPIPWITACLTKPTNQPAITPNIIRLLQAKVEEDLEWERQHRAAR